MTGWGATTRAAERGLPARRDGERGHTAHHDHPPLPRLPPGPPAGEPEEGGTST